MGIEYPLAVLEAIAAKAAATSYQPDPRGLAAAREALAIELSTPTDVVSPDDLFLTASTSEAYSFLFRLLADPGDEILTHTPTYPLLEHLASLDSLRLQHFPLRLHRTDRGMRWALEEEDLRQSLSPRTRAIVVVQPNNPTGSILRNDEKTLISSVCAELGCALISDEVFADYPIEVNPPHFVAAASGGDGLMFTLGGLSKSAGLPHWKLGWIRIGGSQVQRRRARQALELVADAYLSVATPVQQALPEILRVAPIIRDAIRQRVGHEPLPRRRSGSLGSGGGDSSRAGRVVPAVPGSAADARRGARNDPSGGGRSGGPSGVLL